MSDALKRMIDAMERKRQSLNRARYKLPSHKREKWFGGAKEKQDEEIARAGLMAIFEPDHDMTGAVLQPCEDRTEVVAQWKAMLGVVLR